MGEVVDGDVAFSRHRVGGLMELLFVPIERLPERYSDQWFVWFMKAFAKAGAGVSTVGQMNAKHTIQAGEFLDVTGTLKFKASQLIEIIEKIEAGFSGTVFFMDLWFPGLEMLAYLRDTLGLSFRISGILHAGTYDPEDFLSRRGCGSWGNLLEQSWFEVVDRIFVSTAYHEALLRRTRSGLGDKVRLIQFPVFCDEARRRVVKEPLVVFPHRLAPEKHPEIFDTVKWIFEKKFPTVPVRFVRSKDVCRTKEEYYDLLSRAQVVFSSATQETFGIAMQEGINLGAWPVAPRALSYPEMMEGEKAEGLYSNLGEAVENIHAALLKNRQPKIRFTDSADALVREVLIDANYTI